MKKLNWVRAFDISCLVIMCMNVIDDITKDNYHSAFGWGLASLWFVYGIHAEERRKQLQIRLDRALGKF